MYNELIKKIEEQQSKVDRFGPAYVVGEQLKEICKGNSLATEMVLHDLDVSGMGIADCEKKIKELADKRHKDVGGNFAFVSPADAEKIIRDFYGIPDGAEADKPQSKSSHISVDFDSLFDM